MNNGPSFMSETETSLYVNANVFELSMAPPPFTRLLDHFLCFCLKVLKYVRCNILLKTKSELTYQTETRGPNQGFWIRSGRFTLNWWTAACNWVLSAVWFLNSPLSADNEEHWEHWWPVLIWLKIVEERKDACFKMQGLRWNCERSAAASAG